ncbi:MAG: hypothetical protein U1A77_09275 [Pirellulales bacterium]
MSKDKTKDNEEEAGPIDEDSLKLLGDLSKGKARKFVLVYKGAQPTALVLFKKGSVTKYEKEAKTLAGGGGKTCYGVAEGSGKKLVFQLATTDGFKEAPVRDEALKKFLSEHADLACQPEFEIVEVSAIPLDPDDPLTAKYLALKVAAVSAMEAAPDRANALKTLCRQIESHLDADESKQAQDGMQSLAVLITEARKQVASVNSQSTSSSNNSNVPPPPPPPPPAPPTSSPNKPPQSAAPVQTPVEAASEAATRFLSEFKQLKPDVDRALALGTKLSGEVKLAASELATLARSKQYDGALERLPALRTLVERALQEGPSAATTNDPHPGPRQLGKKVLFTQTRLRWDDARKHVRSELERLAQAMRSFFQQEPDFASIDKSISGMFVILEKLDERLLKELDDAYQAQTAEAEAKSKQAAARIVEEYQTFLDSGHWVLQGLDENPFTPVKVRSHLAETLRDLASQLA